MSAEHSLTRIEKYLVAASNLTQGAVYKHNLQPLADSFKGEPAYLAGIRIKGTVSITVGAAKNTHNDQGYYIQRALKNIRLRVAGHDHLVNIDGEDLTIDDALRSGSSRVADLTFPALATGAMTMPVDVFLRLDDPRAPAERRHDNVIACALFSDPQASFLEFQVGSSLDTGTDCVVAAAGFAAGLEIHAYVIHRDDAIVHTPWRLRTTTDTQLEHTIQPNGSLCYLFLANRAVNAATRITHALVDLQSIKVGGEMLHAALTYQDYLDRVRFDRPSVFEALSSAGHANDTLTSTSRWAGMPIFVAPMDERRTKLWRGDITLKYGSMPAAFTDNRFRYLIRETGSTTNDHAQGIAMRLGVDEATAKEGGIYELRAAMGRGEPAAAILPMKLNAPTRFPRARERFGRRARR